MATALIWPMNISMNGSVSAEETFRPIEILKEGPPLPVG